MAETHKPPEQFTLRLRRYRPRVRRSSLLGRAHDRARAPPLGFGGHPAGESRLRRLDRHPLLLPRGDLRLVRGAHQRRTGPRLPHPPGPRPRLRGADGVIEVEPMGNMPVIKDLIVDMDAVHWKKVQRVTPWLIAKQPVPEREYLVRERGDGRHHPVDGLHPVRRLRLGLPGDGGRPGLHRPGGARQGLPLRRRPARRRAGHPPAGPRRRPPGDLRLHALLQVRARPARRASTRWARSCACGGSRSTTRRSSTKTTAQRHEAAMVGLIKDYGLLHEAEMVPRSYGGNSWFGKFHPAAGKELLASLPVAIKGAAARENQPEDRDLRPQDPRGRPEERAADLRQGRVPPGALRAEPVHHRLRRGHEETPVPVGATAASGGESPAAPDTEGSAA